MKKFICITLLMILSFSCRNEFKEFELIQPLQDKMETLDKVSIIEAIILKETNNRNIRNPKEDAVGYLQIRRICVDDVNRILGEEKYSYKDRWCKKKSKEMFWIYQEHYNKNMNLETCARIWNGGPDGYVEGCTLLYYQDVKEIYSKI